MGRDTCSREDAWAAGRSGPKGCEKQPALPEGLSPAPGRTQESPRDTESFARTRGCSTGISIRTLRPAPCTPRLGVCPVPSERSPLLVQMCVGRPRPPLHPHTHPRVCTVRVNRPECVHLTGLSSTYSVPQTRETREEKQGTSCPSGAPVPELEADVRAALRRRSRGRPGEASPSQGTRRERAGGYTGTQGRGRAATARSSVGTTAAMTVLTQAPRGTHQPWPGIWAIFSKSTVNLRLPVPQS